MRRLAAAATVAAVVLCPALAALAAPAASATTPSDPGISWDLTPQQIETSCARATDGARAAIAEAVSAGSAQAGSADNAASASPDNDPVAALRSVEAALAALDETLVAQKALAYFDPDESRRAASSACNELAERLRIDIASDPQIHAIARAAGTKAAARADQQLARVYVERGNRTGAGLTAEARAQLTDLLAQISKLQNDYQQVLSEEKLSIGIGAAEAASLPASFVATLERSDDGYHVPVHMGTWELFMKNAQSARARQSFLDTFFNAGGAANSERVREAVRLRGRVARLAGFPTWAAYQLDTQMAKTPEQAMELVRAVSSRLMPKARDEIGTLAARKAQSGDRTPFAAWDYLYYEEQLEKERYAFSTEEVRQYFPTTHVIQSVLEIYQGLLGVRFDEIRPARAWAADVRQFRIEDAASGRTVGWFYIDIAPRPYRFVRPATFALRSGRALPDGSYLAPLGAIAGNGPGAPPGKPVLFTHKDVVDFFHEIGHLMHITLATAPYAALHGTQVREDFVEAPSQMLENWMWDAATLRKVSRHVDTGRPLPEKLIAQLLARKHVADGVFWTRQSFLAAYDLELHSAPDGERDPDRLWMELMPQFTPLPPPHGTRPAASFLPVMGGYEARYYGYLWSRVYAQDMFTVFEREGLANAATGARYRREILQPGAMAEPRELVRNFLGREPGYDAFYAEVGIGRAPRARD